MLRRILIIIGEGEQPTARQVNRFLIETIAAGAFIAVWAVALTFLGDFACHP